MARIGAAGLLKRIVISEPGCPERNVALAERKIDRLKEMHLTTDLREGAEIVVPTDPALGASWQEASGDLVRAHVGVVLPLVDPACLPPLPGGRHRVLLGNAMVNDSIMALYRRQYAYVDEFYPGGDGYAVRTVHNPENCGRNALLLGASGVEGAAAALEVLDGVLEETRGRLGYTSLSRSDVHEALLPEMTPDAFREWVAEMYRDNLSYYPVEQATFLGLVHHLTNDPGLRPDVPGRPVLLRGSGEKPIRGELAVRAYAVHLFLGVAAVHGLGPH